MEDRAKQLLKTPQGSGLHCCQFVAYCIFGDISQNQGGANGWKNWGTKATGVNDAKVIWQNGHVGFVASGKVYYSNGKGGSHKVKSFQEYLTYVVAGKPYQLRK